MHLPLRSEIHHWVATRRENNNCPPSPTPSQKSSYSEYAMFKMKNPLTRKGFCLTKLRISSEIREVRGLIKRPNGRRKGESGKSSKTGCSCPNSPSLDTLRELFRGEFRQILPIRLSPA